ncbi:hypothetical protein PFISCL1PPCAC_24736, partial [Pristionchus fissidentatus]
DILTSCLQLSILLRVLISRPPFSSVAACNVQLVFPLGLCADDLSTTTHGLLVRPFDTQSLMITSRPPLVSSTGYFCIKLIVSIHFDFLVSFSSFDRLHGLVSWSSCFSTAGFLPSPLFLPYYSHMTAGEKKRLIDFRNPFFFSKLPVILNIFDLSPAFMRPNPRLIVTGPYKRSVIAC